MRISKDALPEVGKLIGMMDEHSKKSYLSNRTVAIFTKFDYADLPKVDHPIAVFYWMITRGKLFKYINLLVQKTGNPYSPGFPSFSSCISHLALSYFIKNLTIIYFICTFRFTLLIFCFQK